MPIVEYDRELPYLHDPVFGDWFPILQLRASVDSGSSQPVDLDAHLDSGSEFSLFDGVLFAPFLDLFTGEPQKYQTASGWTVDARLHKLHLESKVLGKFELKVGLSTSAIKRNLLGRNFFDLFQIGFREHRQMLLLKASP